MKREQGRPGTMNKEQRTRNEEQRTRNEEQRIRNEEQRTRNKTSLIQAASFPRLLSTFSYTV